MRATQEEFLQVMDECLGVAVKDLLENQPVKAYQAIQGLRTAIANRLRASEDARRRVGA